MSSTEVKELQLRLKKHINEKKKNSPRMDTILSVDPGKQSE